MRTIVHVPSSCAMIACEYGQATYTFEMVCLSGFRCKAQICTDTVFDRFVFVNLHLIALVCSSFLIALLLYPSRESYVIMIIIVFCGQIAFMMVLHIYLSTLFNKTSFYG